MKTVKPYIKGALGFDFFCAGLLFLFVKNPKPSLLGLVFGASVNILLFIANYYSINRLLDLPPEKAKTRATFSYMTRMLFYGLTLTVAALASYLNFATTVLGLLSIKFAIYFVHFSHYGRREVEDGSKKGTLHPPRSKGDMDS